MIVKINGIDCEFEDGEYILNIARRNDIFIPAICYLSGCSPTLACRMCMVEADGKKVYSCNAKAKDGMVVESDLKHLWDERNEIMQAYCINHPLQCGVCDKSGECELQNFTHKARVNEQKYYIQDTHKVVKKWGFIDYDPALCIVCERCVTVCKDKIGESALKTTPRGGDAPDIKFKDTMSKDAYAIWTRFQKNLIAPSNGEILNCSFCGECTSVCPTGALAGAKFKYTSNIWELKKIPASNPHSSDCELMYYDVKQTSINNQKRKIYRVSNDFAFATLNTAARYAYDIENEATKDKRAFEKIVNMIQNKQIQTIKFNSFITNEEALILQNLKNKFDLNLINEEARTFSEFLNEFIKESGSFYNGNIKDILKSDFLIIAGTMLRYDNPTLSYKVNNAFIMNKASGVYFHPLEENGIKKYSKNLLNVRHDVFSQEDILYFILQKFSKNENIKANFESFYIEEEKQIIEEIKEKVLQKVIQKDENGQDIEKEVENIITKKETKTIKVKRSVFAKNLGLDEDKLEELLAKKSNFTLIIGSDFYFSKDSKKLAKLLALIQNNTDFKVFLIPTNTNTLGVSLICDLDENTKGQVLGYNEKGDFSFSYDKHSDLASCALNQQEGTFTNYEKRVVPTNAALEFDGYFLNDLANALGYDEEYTINYTQKLPLNRGFLDIKFDDLTNYYDNGGANKRGYELNLKVFDKTKNDDLQIQLCQKTPLKDGEILLYDANPPHQFSKLSNRASLLNESGYLGISKEIATKYNLKNKDLVKLSANNEELVISVKIDENLENGTYLPNFDEKINSEKFFKERFTYAKLQRLDNE